MRCDLNITFPQGDSPDGAEFVFWSLTEPVDYFAEWAGDYYDLAVDIEAVRAIFALKPLTPELVSAVNPGISFDKLAGDMASIGYQ